METTQEPIEQTSSSTDDTLKGDPLSDVLSDEMSDEELGSSPAPELSKALRKSSFLPRRIKRFEDALGAAMESPRPMPEPMQKWTRTASSEELDTLTATTGPVDKAMRGLGSKPLISALREHFQTALTEPGGEGVDVEEGDDTESGGTAKVSDSEELAALFAEEREGISLLGGSHHLEYRLQDDTYVLGVASTWTDISEIHVALRQLGTSNQWKKLWTQARMDHNRLERSQRQIPRAEMTYQRLNRRRRMARSSGGLSDRKEREYQEALKKRDSLNRESRSHAMRLKSSARKFIVQSATEFSTETAEILGAKMPAVTLDSDVAPADAGNVRYHTGAPGDPIPITWYKPAGSYNNVAVTDAVTGAAVNLTPFGANPAVNAQDGNAYTFGVAPAYRVNNGDILTNTPKHGKSRQNQQGYNAILQGIGYNMAGEDGDHVLDLGFGGDDVITNYWPLDSNTNRLAFTGWRSTYYLNYKTGKTLPSGAEEVEKAPLNSGTLVGKSFQITGFQASASPAGNNTAAAGSATGWGNQQNIEDSAGNVVAEG